MEGYKTVWHWTPDDKPAGFIRCTGAVSEGATRPGGATNGLHKVEHRTTRNRMAVNCTECTSCLPEVIALRKKNHQTGTAVVTALAHLGISASYENRTHPAVELHPGEAQKLLDALDAAFQSGVHAGQESAG